jgi:hypothetical protein
MKEFMRDNAVTIAATNSALVSIVVGYPFDSIKTRMQAQKFPSTLYCIKTTYETQGLSGFYRGVLPLMATSTTLRAISWNVYTTIKSKLSLDGIFVNSLSSGMLTGCFMSIFGAPIEFIKVQRQLYRGKAHKNMMEWIRFILKEKGVLGLYSGYGFHAPVDILGTGFYFGVYETFKFYSFYFPIDEGFIPLLGGGLAGSVAWILVFPLDVIKSIVQKEALYGKSSVKYLIKKRFNDYGISGFYRGLNMQLIRSFPVHSLNFYVYENVLKLCKE